jgi:TetR/AcrR family transcriptional regulator, transcriptional repressor for nem operon
MSIHSSPAISKKDQLLHEASRMLLRKGLSGFSLQELAASLNLKKASLFHHFPSKGALAIELYQFYQRSFSEWVAKHERLAPEKQILAYAEELTRWICEKKRVCPVGALSLEWQQVPPELQDEILKLHHLQKDWLSDIFKKMKKKSDLSLPLKDAVLGTMGLLQGSIQLARLTNDPSLVRNNLKSYLKTIRNKS